MGLRKDMLCIMLFVLCAMFFAGSAEVYAAKDMASGSYDGVSWRITSKGDLVIGETGKEFWFSDSEEKRSFPWLKYKSKIKSGSIKGTVHGAGNMSGMFDGVSFKTLDLKGFETSRVTSMRYMFRGYEDDEGGFWLSDLESLDLSGFDTSNVTDMGGMFVGCRKLKNLDLSNFDTGNVTDMSDMFLECAGLESLNLRSFDTAKVINMSGMFNYCCSMKTVDLSSFNTANVSSMRSMFYDCNSLKALDVSGFDTANVIDMSGMFNDCESLTSLDVTGFNTGKVTSMSAMFMGCNGLESLDLTNFTTDNVENMSVMFWGCNGLKDLDVTHFNTENVVSIHQMFSYCDGLKTIDLSGFDTHNMTDIGGLFFGSNNIETLDLSGFDAGKVEMMNYMFEDCTSLKKLALGEGMAYHPEIKKYDYSDEFFYDKYMQRVSTLDGKPAEGPVYINMSYYDGSCPGWYEFGAKTDISGVTVTGIDKEVLYTGKKIVPVPEVTLDGVPLVEGTDYTVGYVSNKSVGTAYVFIHSAGMYTGLKRVSFKILPKGTSIRKVTGGKKKLKVTWKKQDEKMREYRVTGYQIQYSTDKKFKRNVRTVKIKGYKNTSVTIGKLKPKKRYYVRIRTYMLDTDGTYRSSWSKTLSAKVK